MMPFRAKHELPAVENDLTLESPAETLRLAVDDLLPEYSHWSSKSEDEEAVQRCYYVVVMSATEGQFSGPSQAMSLLQGGDPGSTHLYGG
jgi:hypothetical protein